MITACFKRQAEGIKGTAGTSIWYRDLVSDDSWNDFQFLSRSVVSDILMEALRQFALSI